MIPHINILGHTPSSRFVPHQTICYIIAPHLSRPWPDSAPDINAETRYKTDLTMSGNEMPKTRKPRKKQAVKMTNSAATKAM